MALSLKSLEPGSRIFVHYRDADNYWHERILVAKPSSDGAIVATPDGDIYLEEVADYQRWIHGGPRGGLPPVVRAGPVHRFGEVAERQMENLLRQGAVLRATMESELGYPVASEERPKAASPEETPSSLPWFAMETRERFQAGEEFFGKVLHEYPDRGPARYGFGKAILLSQSPVVLGAGDLRLLPARDRSAARLASPFRAEVSELTETPIEGWTVQGPRTTRWLARAISEHHGSPTGCHFWWRHVLGLSAGDHRVDEHLFLSTLLEQGVVSDSYNISENFTFESIARRYQFWEEVYVLCRVGRG